MQYSLVIKSTGSFEEDSYHVNPYEVGDLVSLYARDKGIKVGDIIETSLMIETQGVYGYGNLSIKGEVVFILS